jgi:alkanesulfonate monooxygenase SsuD/methylene tetrahydromethanopterin reductase-like flavin-dependent oxidoreductase (luciferase family)
MVRRAERIGFDSLWVLDHIAKPDLYNTSVVDALSAQNYAAAITDGIDLGTSIFILFSPPTTTILGRFLHTKLIAYCRIGINNGVQLQ